MLIKSYSQKSVLRPDNPRSSGLTVFELIIAVAILAIIVLISIPGLSSFQQRPQLNNSAEEVTSMLRLAQNKTLSSEGNSQYGVYFDTSTSPHQYVLFKGSSYAARDSAFDIVRKVSTITEFYSISLGGGASQVVFDRLIGSTANAGSIPLRLKNETSQTKTIYIDNSGVTSYTPLATSSDTGRLKDSRHISFAYSRAINTGTENITLTFNGSTIQTIPINQYLNNGEIDWTGTFTIGGTAQTMRIHTLRLNNPDTLFSVYRDMRYNNAMVNIKLSGDATGTLAEYSADGLTTTFHSIYVSNFIWQ